MFYKLKGGFNIQYHKKRGVVTLSNQNEVFFLGHTFYDFTDVGDCLLIKSCNVVNINNNVGTYKLVSKSLDKESGYHHTVEEAMTEGLSRDFLRYQWDYTILRSIENKEEVELNEFDKIRQEHDNDCLLFKHPNDSHYLFSSINGVTIG